MSKNWFITTGFPSRNGNVIVPMVDGEASWKDVLSAMLTARETINMAFWMMHLDHELNRPADLEFKDPADRQANTLHDILLKKYQDGVKVGILLWVLPTIPSTEMELLKQIGISSFITPIIPIAHLNSLAAPVSVLATLDLRILKYALEGKFSVLLEPHPTEYIGSWHQKTIIVDSRIAFVGGMNAKENDWDDTHAVFDYRRMPHSSKGSDRNQLKMSKEKTKFPPRHDFMTHIEGPLVMDVQNNFIMRWNQAIKDKRFFYRNQPLMKESCQPKGNGNKSGQIVRTMPVYPPTPMGEKGCLEMYQKAIRNAEKYIYIEDQYFRSQYIALELANAYKRNPKLILVVVTVPDLWADFEWINIGLASPSTKWTEEAFNIIAKVVPDFCLFYLQVNDKDAKDNELYIEVDNHAKLMIVDDEWYTIGSCNINDRGFAYEGEININVHDPDEALKLRKRLWSEHLQAVCPEDIEGATKLWYAHAQKNFEARKTKKRPLSRVFAFVQKGPLRPMVPRTWF